MLVRGCGAPQVGAPVDVRVTVDGEALIDDGVAYVLYSVMLVSRCSPSSFVPKCPTFHTFTPQLLSTAMFGLVCGQS